MILVFRRRHKEAVNNLLRNSHRLTTNFDIHETLKHLLKFGHQQSEPTTRFDGLIKNATSNVPEHNTQDSLQMKGSLFLLFTWQVTRQSPILSCLSYCYFFFSPLSFSAPFHTELCTLCYPIVTSMTVPCPHNSSGKPLDKTEEFRPQMGEIATCHFPYFACRKKKLKETNVMANW